MEIMTKYLDDIVAVILLVAMEIMTDIQLTFLL
jgi:hypothetical protein